MLFTHYAALVAASQPLLSSAAYLPVRQAPQAANITATYSMPNGTSTVFGSTGMARATGASGVASATGTRKAASKTSASAKATETSSNNSTASAPGAIGGLGLDAPVWNLNNNTCSDLAFLNASGQWNAVDGDTVVSKFQDMWQNNKLICSECFGMTQDQCDSKDAKCSQGLRDLSKVPGSDTPRWDTGAARFALNADITDLQCRIQTGVCEGAPDCGSCNGPGSFVILKSLETMNNALMNTYDAITFAGQQCTNQMTAFSSVFAPIPSMKDEAMMLGILTSVVGGLFGFIPGVGGIVGGMLAAVGSSVGMDMFFFNQPGPADTSSVLGMIVNATAQQYVDVADALFTTGTYTYQNADGTKAAAISLPKLMKNGALMQSSGGDKDLYNALVPTYQKIMYQQLAFFTWTNMEKDSKKHTPYIAFANKPCSQVSNKDDGFGSSDILAGVADIKSSITYNNTCYWLLDGTQTTRETFGGRTMISTNVCSGAQSLPGGTKDDMDKNGQLFSGLALEDFIIPSVEGWAKNGKNNDYKAAASNGQLVSDPRSPGAVNIPVCDYIGNSKMPGVNCPKLGSLAKDSGCDSYPRNAIGNAAGAFAPGWCKVHVQQYQRNEGNENPLSVYQLEVAVFDDASRQIGDGTKQAAGSPLAIQGALPYNVLVAPGAGDDDPVQFWYAGQYWDSNSKDNQCSVGKFDGGSRQMDCGFNCPMEQPANNPTASATVGHKLPGAPTPAVAGETSYINTFNPTTPTPTAAPSPTADPKPTYAQGSCGVHVRQHQKNESDNKSGNYALEVTIFDAKHNAIGTSGQVQAPEGKAVPVTGLIKPFTVTAASVDSDPLTFSFNGQTWKSSDKQCSVGKYDSGARDMDCGFTC